MIFFLIQKLLLKPIPYPCFSIRRNKIGFKFNVNYYPLKDFVCCMTKGTNRIVEYKDEWPVKEDLWERYRPEKAEVNKPINVYWRLQQWRLLLIARISCRFLNRPTNCGIRMRVASHLSLNVRQGLFLLSLSSLMKAPFDSEKTTLTVYSSPIIDIVANESWAFSQME